MTTNATGYSLLGHSHEMAEKSNVRLKLFSEKIPLLDGAFEYAEKKFFPGGCHKNKKFYEKQVDFDSGIPDEKKMLFFTPETSGGLLAAVSANSIGALSDLFTRNKQPFWVVGEVLPGRGIEVASD